MAGNGAVSGTPLYNTLVVQTASELAGTVDTGFDSGDRAYVKDLDPTGRFFMNRESVAVVDNVNVINTWSGIGRWLTEGAVVSGGDDKFAPRYLVGNVPAGDPATPQTGAFRYIPDPGDGSGLALALSEAVVNRGDVHLRPGTYGPLAGPVIVPDGVLVVGAGREATIIQGGAFFAQMFVLSGRSSGLRDMQLIGGPGPNVAPFDDLVLMSGRYASLENVLIRATLDVGRSLQYAVRVSVTTPPEPDSNEGLLPLRNVSIIITESPE